MLLKKNYSKIYIIRVEGVEDKYGEPQCSEYIVQTNKTLSQEDVEKFLKKKHDIWLKYWEKEGFYPPIEYYQMLPHII